MLKNAETGNFSKGLGRVIHAYGSIFGSFGAIFILKNAVCYLHSQKNDTKPISNQILTIGVGGWSIINLHSLDGFTIQGCKVAAL